MCFSESSRMHLKSLPMKNFHTDVYRDVNTTVGQRMSRFFPLKQGQYLDLSSRSKKPFPEKIQTPMSTSVSLLTENNSPLSSPSFNVSAIDTHTHTHQAACCLIIANKTFLRSEVSPPQTLPAILLFTRLFLLLLLLRHYVERETPAECQ